MKTKTLLSILFLALAIPFAYADIELSNIKASYNLGDTIVPEVTLNLPSQFSGFQKADITCGNYTTTFSVTPLELSANQNSHSFLPSLTVYPILKGTCTVKVMAESLDKSVAAEKTSTPFTVTDQLMVMMGDKNLTFGPSDTLTIKGVLYNIREEPIIGVLKATLKGQAYNFIMTTSNFSFNIKIPSDIKSGSNDVTLYFEDSKNNFVTDHLTLNIEPKPTALSLQLNTNTYLPYELMKADISIYDQANDLINDGLDIKITSGKKTYLSATTGAGSFNYTFNNSYEPGDYKFTVIYEKLTKETDFKIGELQKLSSVLDGQNVVVTNSGNVRYSNTTIITLQLGEKSMTIQKNINLKPSETLRIDLSKEAAAGNYSVTLPTGEQIPGVRIDDNRNFFKKATEGFGGISGNAVKGVEGVSSKWFSLLVVFLIVIVVVGLLAYLGVFRNMKEGASKMFKKKEE